MRIGLWIWITGSFLLGSGLLTAQEVLQGRVVCGNKGIEGVAVTDGYSIVKTSAKGEYRLPADRKARFVYITTPSGYETTVTAGVADFFQRLDRSQPKKKYDFDLNQRKGDDRKHAFIAFADIQLYFEREKSMLDELIADARGVVDARKDLTFHAIDCGDMVSDKPQLYPVYMEGVSKLELPMYRVMGNHDMVYGGGSQETSTANFEKNFGPAYYSFNRGEVHYIALNTVFYIGRDYFYIGYVPGYELDWLEQDLANVKPGSTVIVFCHIPFCAGEADMQGFSYAKISNGTTNNKYLYQVLSPFNTHIISGHQHTNDNYIIAPNIYEHVTSAACGAWWQDEVGTDGTPKGYGVYEIDGGQVSWYYKSLNRPQSYQFKAYKAGEMKSYPDFVGANVWNWDKDWKVELFEDGVRKCDLERFVDYDPVACDAYMDPSKLVHKWTYPTFTRHLFKAKISPEAKVAEIVVTDRFGNVYRESVK